MTEPFTELLADKDRQLIALRAQRAKGAATTDWQPIKYRKKPVVIEAIQFTHEMAIEMLIDGKSGPFGLTASGEYHRENRTVSRAWLGIKTLEGFMRADFGDWIIRGIQGELYPCKPDIFDATYDPVKPDAGGMTDI